MTMQIKVFDVEHGHCTLITTPNGKNIMIDCGHNDTTGFRPSNYLRVNGLNLDHLIISNVDQDHISDLPNIYNLFPPQILSHNIHIDRTFLNDNKEEITDAMEDYIALHESYTNPIVANDFGGIELFTFSHDVSKFQDTNNLSLVTFIKFNGVTILSPGDLEVNGWLEFLTNQEFINLLADTKIFIASHHGRESGYCPEVFNYCHPDIILISDEDIKYDTQKDIGYARHSRGISFNGNIKKVLTTRNNGMITIFPGQPNNYNINIQNL